MVSTLLREEEWESLQPSLLKDKELAELQEREVAVPTTVSSASNPARNHVSDSGQACALASHAWFSCGRFSTDHKETLGETEARKVIPVQ